MAMVSVYPPAEAPPVACAQEGARARGHSEPMADRIRWGILSTANIAVKRFIPGVVASRNGVVAAIAGRDRAKTEAVAARLGIPRVHDGYAALLADPDIDAIYNPLPNSLHAEWTLAAAAAGKPILCEKPLAIDASQAQAVVDGCRERGVLLMEAFMYRFHPQHARVRELIAENEIGDVRTFRASFNFMLEPFDPKNVRLQRGLAGGALMDVGCYAVNAARSIFGEEPTWVSAQSDRREEFGVEVAMAGILGFSDRRMATFDCGFRAAGPGSYSIGGTKGAIDVTDAFVPDPNGDVTIVVSGREGRREERLAGIDQYKLEAEAFGDAIARGTPLPVEPEDAVANLRALEALHRSAATGGRRETPAVI
jgi:xylose dehydrogenase (NAD/NADP)